ncbi:MAG: response regulator [Spirochaetia bacterium]|jgi:CheY-like chemotaxis protein|nr:response regulator [Spirochaetia bacterium]
MYESRDLLKIKILIVEDEFITALSLKTDLSRKGYNVIGHVASGAALLKFMETDSPDLILLDISLIGSMDGIEAAMKIRETSEIPIIFMTGFSDDITLKRVEMMHPLAILTKPLKISQIHKIIQSIWKDKQI